MIPQTRQQNRWTMFPLYTPMSLRAVIGTIQRHFINTIIMKTLAKYINKLEDETRLEAIWWQIEDEATNLYNTLTNPRYWKNIKKAIIDDRTIDTERFAIDFRGNFFEQLQKSLEYYMSDDCFVDFKQHKEEYKVMREMNQMFTDRDRLRDKFDEALV